MLRHQGVSVANRGKIPSWSLRKPVQTHPARALVHWGAKGRVRYATGAAMGLAGAPALAVGVHDLTHRKVRKAAKQRDSFLHEGITGTQDALHQRAASMREAPPQAKAGPFAVAAGAGAAGSLAAHRGLDRVKSFRGARHGSRAGIAATAGALAAGASFPLARHFTSHGYEVTPAGVRRRRRTAKRPSSGQKVLDQKTMSAAQFRDGVVGKAADPEHGWWAHAQHFENPKHDHFFGPHNTRMEAEIALDQHWESTEGSTDYDDQTDGGDVFHGLPPWRTKPAIRPHTASERATRQKRDARGRFTKADSDYLGRRTSRRAQTAAILGAGSTPLVGNMAAASTAARFAPPGQAHHAAARQYAGGSGGAISGAAVGGYGLAHLAHRYESVDRASQRAASGAVSAKTRVRGLRPVNAVMARMNRMKAKLPKGSGRGAARAGRAKEAAMATRLARPLARNKVAAGVGLYAGKTVGGWVGGSQAMHHNFKAQDRYNLKHPVNKLAPAPTGLSRDDQARILRRKRRATHTQVLTSTLGLAGAGMGAALLPGVRGKLRPKTAQTIERAAVGTGLAAGGIAGVHGIRQARLSRHELDAQARAQGFRKASKGAFVPANVAERAHRMAIAAARRGNVDQQKRMLALRNREIARRPVGKADNRQPLTRMHDKHAARLVRQFGDAGPLPKELGRQQRMDAYAARYVHAGGHKAEHWQRRADNADKAKTAGLAGATAGGAAMLALKHRRIAGMLGHRVERARHAVDAATIGAATAGGAAELYAGHARRKRSSYSNSKAGVAASALRRMQDYSS